VSLGDIGGFIKILSPIYTMEIKVYSTPSCPWCKKLKEFLKEHNFKFKEIDVSNDAKALAEMEEKSGRIGVPVTDIDGKIVFGFDEAKLKEALKL